MSRKPLDPPKIPPVVDWTGEGRPGANACVTCSRTVDPDTIVSHGVRGAHTCKDAAGVVPPYADPANEEERASTEAARARRFAAHREKVAANDPERPFE